MDRQGQFHYPIYRDIIAIAILEVTLNLISRDILIVAILLNNNCTIALPLACNKIPLQTQ